MHARECTFESASNVWPSNMMMALLETLDEDSCDAYQNPDHRHHSFAYVDEQSQNSISKEEVVAASGEATDHGECGSAQVAGTNYSNDPSPSEAILTEASETLNFSSVLQRSPNERFIIKVIKPEGVSMGMSVEQASDRCWSVAFLVEV